MEKETGLFESLFNDAREYFHLRQELLKLQVTDKLSGVISKIVSIFFTGFFVRKRYTCACFC